LLPLSKELANFLVIEKGKGFSDVIVFFPHLTLSQMYQILTSFAPDEYFFIFFFIIFFCRLCPKLNFGEALQFLEGKMAGKFVPIDASTIPKTNLLEILLVL
jgi:hypothetical protein